MTEAELRAELTAALGRLMAKDRFNYSAEGMHILCEATREALAYLLPDSVDVVVHGLDAESRTCKVTVSVPQWMVKHET